MKAPMRGENLSARHAAAGVNHVMARDRARAAAGKCEYKIRINGTKKFATTAKETIA